MLVLTRKIGQCIDIELHESLDPATPIGELFRDGPIKVMVTHLSGEQVRIGIRANRGFLILRDDTTRRDRYPLGEGGAGSGV